MQGEHAWSENIQLIRATAFALTHPSSDLGDETVTIWDAPIQALAAQHADLDLDHVYQLLCLGAVELDFLEDAVRFAVKVS